MQKYVAYFRVSTNKQGASGLGLEGQRNAVSAFLEHRSGELVKSFTEIKSGKRDDNRPELQKALRECRLTGATLLVAKLDRLARSARFLMELQESDVDFVCADMPEANKLTVQLMASLAEYERTLISERTRAAYHAKKKISQDQNQPLKWGNPNMQAIRNSNTEKATQARIQKAQSHKQDIREIIDEIRCDSPYMLSSNAVAKRLNEAGYKTSSGKSFTHTQVIRAMA